MTRFARYSWSVLAINLVVILWGAFVRASGSGAGCGAHWPLCNGVIVPQAPATATVIEFVHRLTSAAALLSVVLLLAWARRLFAPGAPARVAAHAAMLFIVTEALVGAGLVLFEMVARNTSIARGWWMSAHLVNTFLLLASLTLTASLASGARVPRLRGTGMVGTACAALALGALLLGVSGAITALGDTLYPAESLRAGMEQDLGASAHLFVRLRVWHPVLAVLFAGATLWATRALARRANDAPMSWWANVLATLIGAQLVLGGANIMALAPIWLQLAHLLMADLVWIALVRFIAAALAAAPKPASVHKLAFTAEPRKLAD